MTRLIFLSLFLIASQAKSQSNIAINLGPLIQGSQSINPLASNFIPAMNYVGPTWICASDISTKVFQQGGNCADAWALTVSTPSGIRNEVVGGQIHIINAPSKLQNVSISVSNLTNAQTGQVISTNTTSATNNLVVYVDSYVYVSTPSVRVSSSGYYGLWNVEIPDALVPTVDPYYHQTTSIMPLTVQSGFNQSFWYDIWVPTGIASGYYAGNIYISTGSTGANATVIATMPLVLEVFDATMPVTATFGTFNTDGYGDLCTQTWGSNTTCNRYGKYGCSSSDSCAQIVAHDECVWMLDHRWSCAGAPSGGWSFNTLQPIFDNILRSSASATYINPILTGAHLTSFEPDSIGGSNSTTYSSYATGFSNDGYNTALAMPFAYDCDEPSGGTWASTCFPAASAGKTAGIANLITQNYSNFLIQGATGTVNIMNTLVEDYSTANKNNTVAWVNVAAGSTRAFGYYDDCESGGNQIDGTGPCIGTSAGGSAVGAGTGFPNHHVDGRSISNRASWWVMMADTATFQLNSTATFCFTGTCTAAAGTNSVWTQPALQAQGLGDENWLYNGGPFQVVGSTPIYVGSIRFDLAMAGEQDAEYWNILNTNGLVGYAQDQLATWYNYEAVFNTDAYKPTGSFTGTLTTARQNMGCKIHSLQWPGATCGW